MGEDFIEIITKITPNKVFTYHNGILVDIEDRIIEWDSENDHIWYEKKSLDEFEKEFGNYKT